LGQGKHFIVGSKSGAVSTKQLENAINMLCDAHPRSKFTDYREKSKKGRMPSDLNAVIQLLLKKEVDIVVADLHELPLKLRSELELAAVIERGNPFNVLISGNELILDDQPDEACIAVVNSIIKGQLLYYRSDLSFVEDSSNFERLNSRMDGGEVSGFVMPAFDIEVLNQQEKVTEVFTSSICMPEAGQGAWGFIIRSDDKDARIGVRDLNHSPSFAEINLERMFLRAVLGNGKGPVGVLSNVEENEFQIEAAVISPDGARKIVSTVRGWSGEEIKIVGKLADELLSSGGEDIIKSYKGSREVN